MFLSIWNGTKLVQRCFSRLQMTVPRVVEKNVLISFNCELFNVINALSIIFKYRLSSRCVTAVLGCCF